MRRKEVINIKTAERLGYVSDVEISERTGTVEALIVPRRGAIFWRFFGGGELIIPWKSVEAVGEDIVLVRLFDTNVEKLT